ncbi:uncharacterized protein LOC114952327 [Acropora millepora]|uniref:uncharacterized protein LOC114952327 n=2 Tax=Acropora TaxID=6127 RepID=UPI0010FC9BEF|nr:uncharacterized protein LOC114952327 [Acropora millepora]
MVFQKLGKEPVFFLVLICVLSEAAPFCNVGPLSFVKGQTAKIECDFMGYTGHLLWFKDGKLLKNGTQGLYQSSVQLSNGTTRSTLQFPVVKMNHEASYRCEAANSRMTRGCPNGKITSVVVLCGLGHVTAVDKTVYAMRFSSARLTCSALSWYHCYVGPVKLTWHFGNKTLQNSTKYTITTEHHKKSECKRRLFEAESTLEIASVSNRDFGEYHCQLSCLIFPKTDEDIIELVAEISAGGFLNSGGFLISGR